MKCFNCGAAMFLESFIKAINPSIYDEYRLEKWKEEHGGLHTQKKEVVFLEPTITRPNNPDNPFIGLSTIASLPDTFPAKSYLQRRKIPEEFYSGLYYTDRFQEFTNSVIPDTFSDNKKDHPRIIIPFLDEAGNAFAYQGRSLGRSDSLRYITIKLDESMPKVYGLNRFDPNRQGYVIEGPFDSMFLPNCLAMAGSDLSSYPVPQSTIFIFDNERRNKEIVGRMDDIIQRGYNIVIWPDSITEKDVNDMILTNKDVMSIVNSNTFSGMKAQLRLKQWSRV